MERRLSLIRGDATARDSVDADALLRSVARGDEQAFTRLYDLVIVRVYGLVRRVVRDPAQAEEVAQEIMVEVWRKATRFDPAKGSATAWIFTIAYYGGYTYSEVAEARFPWPPDDSGAARLWASIVVPPSVENPAGLHRAAQRSRPWWLRLHVDVGERGVAENA
jgi:hypothetical protein